jgi:hypothetical protein
MIKNRKRTREDIQRVQELRRSNAAVPMRNKSKYTRKAKHRHLTFDHN